MKVQILTLNFINIKFLPLNQRPIDQYDQTSIMKFKYFSYYLPMSTILNMDKVSIMIYDSTRILQLNFERTPFQTMIQ